MIPKNQFWSILCLLTTMKMSFLPAAAKNSTAAADVQIFAFFSWCVWWWFAYSCLLALLWTWWLTINFNTNHPLGGRTVVVVGIRGCVHPSSSTHHGWLRSSVGSWTNNLDIPGTFAFQMTWSLDRTGQEEEEDQTMNAKPRNAAHYAGVVILHVVGEHWIVFRIHKELRKTRISGTIISALKFLDFFRVIFLGRPMIWWTDRWCGKA